MPRGQRARIEIPVARMPTQVMVTLPVRVVHGAEDGVRLCLSAAIHGDEINGVEIIRQVLDVLDPADMAGSVVAAPIVNVFGFSTHSRYLPDRRDLNRSFPGSKKGSLWIVVLDRQPLSFSTENAFVKSPLLRPLYWQAKSISNLAALPERLW